MLSSVLHPKIRAKAIHWELALKEKLRGSTAAALVRGPQMEALVRRPEQVDIEVTSICDADCIMCPRRSMARRQEPMAWDLYRKIVDEAIALRVPKLVLNGYGEISTLKTNLEYLAYIRQKSSTVKIVINTNGMRMDEALRGAYLKYKIDVVNITIDGATAETFEAIRRHLKLDQVEGNVRSLLEERKKQGLKNPYVGVFMIVMEKNRHETEAFLKKWDGIADYVGLTGLVSRIDSVIFAQATDKKWERTPCSYLWNQMPILSDGTVALCCDDWDGQGKLGNARESSLKDLWFHQERQRLRLIHLAGKAGSIPLCAGCRQPRQGPWWFPKAAI